MSIRLLAPSSWFAVCRSWWLDMIAELCAAAMSFCRFDIYWVTAVLSAATEAGKQLTNGTSLLCIDNLR